MCLSPTTGCPAVTYLRDKAVARLEGVWETDLGLGARVGRTDPATEGRESEPMRKSAMHRRNLIRV